MNEFTNCSLKRLMNNLVLITLFERIWQSRQDESQKRSRAADQRKQIGLMIRGLLIRGKPDDEFRNNLAYRSYSNYIPCVLLRVAC